MGLTTIIGLVGSLLLALCGLPEALSARKKGRCDVGYGFLCMWLLGEILVLLYNHMLHQDMWLYINYLLNICFIVIMLRYKVFPRRENDANY